MDTRVDIEVKAKNYKDQLSEKNKSNEKKKELLQAKDKKIKKLKERFAAPPKQDLRKLNAQIRKARAELNDLKNARLAAAADRKEHVSAS